MSIGVALVSTVKSSCFMNNFEPLITLQAVWAIKCSHWDLLTYDIGGSNSEPGPLHILACPSPSSYSSSVAADGLGAPALALPMLDSAKRESQAIECSHERILQDGREILSTV